MRIIGCWRKNVIKVCISIYNVFGFVIYLFIYMFIDIIDCYDECRLKI